MTTYMLDTSAASEAMLGHAAFDAKLLAVPTGHWCISAVTYSELRYGAALRPENARLQAMVSEFLRMAPVLAWDAKAADRHGALRAELRALGMPIGDFDEMIAAHGLAIGAVVVTDNTKQFSRVPGLLIENWLRPVVTGH